MKYLKQVVILLLITFLSEVLRAVIPMTIPAGIYGMILLFAALALGVVKLEHVKDVGKFLIDIMPIMFIPPAVGLMEQGETIKSMWLQLSVMIAVTTYVVIFVAGKVVDLVAVRENRGQAK